MNDLIKINNENGVLTVSSLQIAKDFEKEHRVILKAIDDTIEQMGVAQNYADLFIPTEYTHEQNKQTYREYLLTRDGFSLLVMGFTGQKALQWKLKYIEAFNKMEQALKEPKQLSAMELLKLQYRAIEEQDEKINKVAEKVNSLEDNMPLFNIDCEELQAQVKKIGVAVLGGKNSPAYNDNSTRQKVYVDIQHQLKREFGVNRYKAIKRCQLKKALATVSTYKVPMVLEEEINNLNNQIRF